MTRLPATCIRCNARVELRLAGQAEEVSEHYGNRYTRDLPTAWCEPGTWTDHRCADLVVAK